MSIQTSETPTADQVMSYYVRPLVARPGSWWDCLEEKATHFGVNCNPEISDELICILPSKQAAQAAVDRLNAFTADLLRDAIAKATGGAS
jgi:hypothetical protein